MAHDQAVTARNVSVPTELNPFLVQVVAVGVGPDLRRACDAAHASLRKRATQIRTGLGFPTAHGMYYARNRRLSLAITHNWDPRWQHRA